jgi:hypothetical protein
MPRPSNKQTEPPDIKVVIRNPQGKYLAGNATNWFFTDERSAAIIFDYRADRVPEQLEQIRKAHGLALAADPVPLDEIYETCDRCQELFMPSMILFDGKRFLCAECRRRASPRPAGA